MNLLKAPGVITLSWEQDWNPEGYLLMPGAVYAGNRHQKLSLAYPPFVPEGVLRRPDAQVLITDIPALNPAEGISEICQRSGDLSTPAVGYYNPDTSEAVLLLGVHHTRYGYTEFDVKESDDRRSCTITYKAISVRPYTYTMCNSHSASDDIASEGCVAEEFELPYQLITFSCYSVNAFFDRFFSERKTMGEDCSLIEEPGYQRLMDTYIRKYNQYNWNAKEGFYMSGVGGNLYQEWQSGWTGGGMFTLALYRAGDSVTKNRVLQSLDFYFNRLQNPKGWFYAVYYQGKIYGDDFANPDKANILMSRKQADMLYFLLLQYREFGAGHDNWKQGLIRGLDAAVRMYRRYGHWGQFVDIDTEDILIGATASAGLMPGALMLGYELFGDEVYQEAALGAGRYYYEHFTAKGIANGGPGEILQCSDSESAFALVESFVVLYEHTKDEYWLTAAKAAANIFATWVVSYNFDFPETCEFARLGIKTTGSVIANCQNKHSAPGICAMSGDTLIRLYQYTGDTRYYDLIRDIARNIPQYTSTEERPIHAVNGEILPPGFSCERVNMSDWEGQDWIGGVWNGSCCWCETAAMLTATEPLFQEI